MNNGIGVLIHYRKDTDLEFEIKKAMDMQISSCQLCMWDEALYCDENAAKINAAIEKTGFKITTLWAGYSGPCEWNFVYGPATIGLVPPAYRDMRVRSLKMASDFAEKINVKMIATHVGFIPENPDNVDYSGTVGALRNVCR